jgi:CheY-like chemotaxis protein
VHEVGPATLRRVRDGAQAIAYLAGAGDYADRAAYPMPDVLLLDLNMPCYKGREVLHWLRERSDLRHLPVIVLSGVGGPEAEELVLVAGGDGFLQKPPAPGSLARLFSSLGFVTGAAHPAAGSRGVGSGDARSGR